MMDIFEAVNKSFKESGGYYGEGDIVKISVCPNAEDSPVAHERFKGCVRAIVESSTGEKGCCYTKKKNGSIPVVCYADGSAKWIEYDGYFVAEEYKSSENGKPDIIIVNQLPDGSYAVNYDDERTSMLSYDDMMEMVASIAMPESRPCIQGDEEEHLKMKGYKMKNNRKTVIEIEEVSNGFIINDKNSGVKKVAENAEEVSKIIAGDLLHLFEQIEKGKIKTLEFELK